MREGVAYATARRWFAAGKLPVPARKVGGLILVDVPAGEIPRLAAALVAACGHAFGPGEAVRRAHDAVDAASAGDAG